MSTWTRAGWIIGGLLAVLVGVAGLALVLASAGLVTLPVKVTYSAETLAGATLMLVSFGVFAWLANTALASATRQLAQQGDAERLLRRAHLDVIFDPAQPALWWEGRQWVRVMATNTGPAMAGNVVMMLEKIEPADQSPIVMVRNGNRRGLNVLPTLLDRKGVTQPRERPLRCDINPQSREYYDVLVYRLTDTTGSPEVAFSS